MCFCLGSTMFHQTFQVPKTEESSPIYKLYGYGLCEENPAPKIASSYGSVPPCLSGSVVTHGTNSFNWDLNPST